MMNTRQNINKIETIVHYLFILLDHFIFVRYYVFFPPLCHNAIAIHQHKLNDFNATGIGVFLLLFAVVSKTQLRSDKSV